MARYSCGSCGTEIDRDDAVCSVCGSSDHAVEATAEVAVGLEVGVRAKARRGSVGEVRPHREQRSEVVWNHNRQRQERRVILVDRENDHYRQEWRDLQTDEVMFAKEGALSDPDMHGLSARQPRADISEQE